MSEQKPRRVRPSPRGARRQGGAATEPVTSTTDSTSDTRTATAPARITANERRRRRDVAAARLRAQGMSYLDVAAALGFADQSGAHKSVRRALDASARLPTDEARVLALNRLDVLRARLQSILDDPASPAALVVNTVRALLDVEKREAALLGLDQPTKSERTTIVVKPETTISPAEFDREIARLTADLAALDKINTDSTTYGKPHRVLDQDGHEIIDTTVVGGAAAHARQPRRATR